MGHGTRTSGTTLSAGAGTDVLVALAEPVATRQSGIVGLSRGRHRRLLCLDQGWLVHADSNVIEERCGAFLARHGVLDLPVLAEAERAAQDSGRKLARLLLDDGLVSEADLRRALEAHARELLRASLAWGRAECSFRPGRPDLAVEFAVRLSCAPEVLARVVELGIPPAELRSRIAPPGARLACTPRAESALAELPEGHPARSIAAACDGEHDVAGIAEGDGAAGRLALLWGLRLLGVVEPRVEEAEPVGAARGPSRDEVLARVARAEGADYYAILGLGRRASASEVREAYYQLALRFHPDRFRAGALVDLLPSIEGYFAKVTEAYNTLHVAASRAAYDEQLSEARTQRPAPEQDSTGLARQNYLRARALIEKRRLQDAVGFLENAVQLDGSKAAYRLELGSLLAQNPRRRKDAEEQLLEATNLDPTLVPAFLELGRLYVKLDRREDAARMFRHVLRWEATNAEAQAELEALGERAGASTADKLRDLLRG